MRRAAFWGAGWWLVALVVGGCRVVELPGRQAGDAADLASGLDSGGLEDGDGIEDALAGDVPGDGDVGAVATTPDAIDDTVDARAASDSFADSDAPSTSNSDGHDTDDGVVDIAPADMTDYDGLEVNPDVPEVGDILDGGDVNAGDVNAGDVALDVGVDTALADSDAADAWPIDAANDAGWDGSEVTAGSDAVTLDAGIAGGCDALGSEQCGNGKDDDCDGETDEGCGPPVAAQVLLVWPGFVAGAQGKQAKAWISTTGLGAGNNASPDVSFGVLHVLRSWLGASWMP